jgi:hypothetical protein
VTALIELLCAYLEARFREDFLLQDFIPLHE